MVAQQISSGNGKELKNDESDWEERKIESFMEDMTAS